MKQIIESVLVVAGVIGGKYALDFLAVTCGNFMSILAIFNGGPCPDVSCFDELEEE